MRIAVTGSSGLIGSALVAHLRDRGHQVHRMVRSQPVQGSGDIAWNPDRETIDAERLNGVDAVVHLAGENVGVRWTDERKREIRSSRVGGTRLIAHTLATLPSPPRVLIAASAVGFYGSRGDEVLDETSAQGSGFLAEVVRDWEGAAVVAADAGIRVVNLRLGVVLDAAGGALAKMLPPFRLGAGGRLGSGRQWMSWVALDDVISVVERGLADSSLHGPVNVVAPDPVTNAELTTTLARVLHRPGVAAVPGFALRILLGQMADETILASQRATPAALLARGHVFRYPELEPALRATLGTPRAG